MLRLGNAAARRLFLHRHGLAEHPTGSGKGSDLLELVTSLGFVQVDSVRTVERAHDMILFARRPAYRPGNLKPLLERNRTLFEHWTHDAAVIPTAFYPYWRQRFDRNRDRLRAKWEKWHGAGYDARFGDVVEEVRKRGAVSTSDVGTQEQRSSGGWWDWNPSKTALEYHWHCGDLAVCHREGFRKHYDLSERVIPAPIRAHQPDADQTRDWLCRSALGRLGFGTGGEIAAFWDAMRPHEARAWAVEQMARGTLIELEIEASDGSWRKAFARPDVLDAADNSPCPTGRLRVLSPFDPALRDRKRAERLFGFSYRIEIFTPAPKRQYGYYVFPLLEGDRLVGRIDMTAHRGDGQLDVRALWPERDVRWGKGRQSRLEAELTRVARFAGLEGLRWQDGWLRQPM